MDDYPGKHLKEILLSHAKAMLLEQADYWTEELLEQFLLGRAEITMKQAFELAAILQMEQDYWYKLQSEYDKSQIGWDSLQDPDEDDFNF